ncbi:MAG: mitochondrial fission ELM1 family protein [Legionellales bacterium]|nr:mitochondrial fission ELM1 family protein [Legionellales bacterium]
MKALTIGIFVLVSAFRTGDNGQAEGIVSQLNEEISSSTQQVQIYGNFDNSKKLLSKLTKTKNDINLVIGIGRLGISQIVNIQNENIKENVIYLWSGHQVMKNMFSMGEDTVIALPKYAVNKNVVKKFNRIIPILGVPNNVTENKLVEAYTGHGEINKIQKPISLVVIPGDAIDPSLGTYRLYTDDDAEKLADYIAEKIKIGEIPAYLQITNGPRTGKYSKSNKKPLNVHGINLKDKDIKIELDYVTRTFCNRLKKLGVDYTLYNFDYRFLPSDYYPLLGCALKNRGSKIFVPGASSSMVSEISDIFPFESYVMIQGPNMNFTHHMDIDIRHELGANLIVQKVDKTYISLKQKSAKETSNKPNAKIIAKHIKDIIS